VAHPPLGGILTGVHQSRAPIAGKPCHEATQGGDEGGRVTPRSISPSPEDADLVGTLVPYFLATRLAARRYLSLLTRPHDPVSGITHLLPKGPRMDRHPATYHDHPQDPVQNHEYSEKKES
jgi:hypothetical protein